MADIPATAQGPAQNIEADPDVSTNSRWTLTVDVTDACPSSSIHPTLASGMMCMCVDFIGVSSPPGELISLSIGHNIPHP